MVNGTKIGGVIVALLIKQYANWIHPKTQRTQEQNKMSEFEGFTLGYSSAPDKVDWETQPCIVTCNKCGRWAPKGNGYMKDVCEEITCPNCGHKASRKSDSLRTNEK